MSARAYVETSIPSFYFEARVEPEMVARRTWTRRKHLANANKFGHIRRINTLLGLYNPALVTPLELLGADNDS